MAGRTVEERNALQATLALGLGYLLVGTLWILFSDGLVEALSRDADWLVAAQRYKGLVYIAVTTAGLVFLVHRGFRRLLALQERVQRSDLRVQDLFERHPQPMWVHDLQTSRFLRVNAAAVAAYGWSREELFGLRTDDLRPAPEPTAPGPDPAGVLRHRTRDGRTVLARISEHRVELDGRPAMMVMAEDVTEEVGLQDAVRRQQRQFQQLHDSLGEVLWMASPDFGAVTYVSPAFATVYGRDPGELLADPRVWRDAVHPDDVGQVADLSDLEPGHDSVQCEYRIVRPDGSVRWIEDRKRLVRDPAGTVVLIGGIAEDITARKERDEARDALNSRLEALVEERTADLQQANIELEAFTRTAAHDLKSPLNGIAGMSGLLRLKAGDRLDPQSRRYLELIERSSRDMATLINDLLALSRVGSVELARSAVDLAPVVQALVEEARALEPLRRVEVTWPAPLEMFCDPGLMRSVLQNLFGNAWKFTSLRDDAHIVLTLARGERESVLTVADNGDGFDTRGIGPLLRPFQRFHTQAQFQGTGLGLVTCQRIVHRHGGHLAIQSAPGEGTRVSVVLPNAPPPPGKPAAADRAA